MGPMTGPQRRTARLGRALERAISEGHPWIWRDALRDLDAAPGDVVTVRDRKGRFLCRGLADGGPIGVRVWTTRDEPLDDALLRRRVEAAAALRSRARPDETDCYRLVHGEGDRMPGMVCDVYGAHAVLRLDGAGIARWRDSLVRALIPVLESLGGRSLLLRGARRERAHRETLWGDAPEMPIEVREHGMRLLADLWQGQKTGLFLDHRESRRRVRGLCGGLRVLNLYGYTGGFSIAAGLGGAHAVETVDVAEPALDLARRGWTLNGLPEEGHRTHEEDVPEFLEATRRRGVRFDLIVSDPPSFAPRESALKSALASYRKLHAACLALLEPGGVYLAASCSSHVRREAFERTVLEGARAGDRVLQVLSRWGAPPDHPRLLAFPEGDYLKVLLARVSD